MLFTNHLTCFAPEGPAGAAPAAAVVTETPAAEAPVTETTTETPAAPVKGKRGARAAPAVAEIPAETPAAPAGDLQEVIKMHARLDAVEARAAAIQEEAAGYKTQIETYKGHAAQVAEKMLASSPDFVKARVTLDKDNPLETIAQIENMSSIYEAAKKDLGGTGSAPPPSAAGSPAGKPKSVWEPTGPTPRNRR